VPTIAEIFKSEETKHRLTLFRHKDIQWLEAKLFEKNGKPYLKCLASDKDRPAKPEEIVRQLWIKRLLDDYHYPKERIKVERSVWFGSGVSDKSADIVILHTDGEHLYIIFEVKKPKRKDGLQQLKSYCNAEGSPIGVWSNGEELVILHREEPNVFTQISSVPTVDQALQDVISEQWTIDKLTVENKLVREKLSLKKIILDLEDLVLANAEGIDDSFDEVFKLIYAKLYDEWAAANDPARLRKIHFRIYGESPRELYNKINNLFNRAKDKWRGIFSIDERIRLKPEHLQTCVSFLQDVKLFNANLQIIDEAFEYLVTEVAKGKKGQYFTPRWVIDMCVKMLNPKIGERVIDTACGSSGFTVHSVFYVAGDQFSTNGLPPQITEYAGTMVYAIDSSPKAVKIAKALNLIAGDGKSNVYELNSLNPPKWSEEGKSAFRSLLTRFSDEPALDEENQREFKYFDFDILMTNPPFAGNINERMLMSQILRSEDTDKRLAIQERAQQERERAGEASRQVANIRTRLMQIKEDKTLSDEQKLILGNKYSQDLIRLRGEIESGHIGERGDIDAALEGLRQEGRIALEDVEQTGRKEIEGIKSSAEGELPTQTKVRQYNTARKILNENPIFKKYIILGNPGTNDFQLKGDPNNSDFMEIRRRIYGPGQTGSGITKPVSTEKTLTKNFRNKSTGQVKPFISTDGGKTWREQ